MKEVLSTGKHTEGIRVEEGDTFPLTRSFSASLAAVIGHRVS